MGIQILVLAQLIQKTLDLVQMNEPSIQSYTRPLYEAEVNEQGDVNLYEERFNFGVYFTAKGDTLTSIEIP